MGPNRLIAKIASDFHKPDGLTVVKPHQVRGFLDPLAVRKLHGVGPATEKALAELGVTIIADLRRLSLAELEGRFGRHGAGLYHYSRGIDERPVRTHRERKSLGHERTYAEDIRDLALMDAELEKLSVMVAEGLQRREIAGRTITVKARYPDFTTLTRARTLPQPTTSASLIAATAKDLLRQTAAAERHVRLLGVTASALVGEGEEAPDDQPEQLRLFETR